MNLKRVPDYSIQNHSSGQVEWNAIRTAAHSVGFAVRLFTGLLWYIRTPCPVVVREIKSMKAPNHNPVGDYGHFIGEGRPSECCGAAAHTN